MILTPEQLRELTGKERYSAQRRALDHMRIPYRVRPDGSLVVLLADVAATSTMPPEPELQP